MQFGEVERVPLEDYEIVSPDGITLNGVFYARGKRVVDKDLIDTIKELDEPYRTGKIKTGVKRVDVVGKAHTGTTPTHSKKHSQSRPVNRIPAKKQKDEVNVTRWKLPKL